MVRRRLLLVLAAAMLCACGSGGSGSRQGQMSFAADMAKRGLWREAAFRWEKALASDSKNYRLHNNLGVAYESSGDYPRALTHYKKAVELAGGNDYVRRNYTRFAEFYKSYFTRKENKDKAAAPKETSAPTPATPSPKP